MTAVAENRRLTKAVKEMPQGIQWPFVPHPATKDDLDLVYAGWIDSLRSESPFCHMRRKEFKAGQTEVIDAILARPNVEVLVAASPDGEPKFGFICYEWDGDEFILHYIYVRNAYRKHNIACSLLQYAGCRVGSREIIVSHWTRDMRRRRKTWKLVYNPWLVWRSK